MAVRLIKTHMVSLGMNEDHPKSCRCVWHVARAFLRYIPPDSHPLDGATLKIASWGGSRSGSGEPDRAYDVVVEWSDLDQALHGVRDPFLKRAGLLRVYTADGYMVGTLLRGEFSAEWQRAAESRKTQHQPELTQDEDARRIQWRGSCSCSWTIDILSETPEVDGMKAIRSHLSPLREALELCAQEMAEILGTSFGVRSKREGAPPPPPELHLVPEHFYSPTS